MSSIKNLNPSLSFLVLFFPVSLILGPAIYELNAFLLIFFFFFSKEKNLINNVKEFKLLFYFYLYLIFVSIFSTVIDESLNESVTFLRFILFSIALLFFIENDVHVINKFYKILSVIIILFFFDSLFQYYFGTNILGIKQQNPFRVSSFFTDELIMGGFFFKLFPLFIAIHYFVKRKFDKYFYIYLFIFEIIIFLSGERAALILYNMLIFLLFIIFKELRKKILLILTGLIVLIVLFLFLDKNYKQRYIFDTLQGLTIKQHNLSKNKINIISNEHESHYRTAINIYKKNIFFGSGPKTFRVECKKPEYKFDQRSCATHPHNYYIELLSETGIVGFLFLLLFYIAIIYEIIKNHKSNNYEYLIILLGLSVMFFPLSPSGSFFNNLLSYFHFMNLTFLIYFKKKIK